MTDIHPDYPFAEEICRKLLSGNRNAMVQVHARYHVYYTAFARRRLMSMNGAEDVVNEFWIELMDGSKICAYTGKGSASLGAFLLTALKWRLNDRIKKIRTEASRRIQPIRHQEDDSTADDDLLQSAADVVPRTPEKLLIDKQRRAVIYESLLELGEQSPKDAEIIRLHLLDGLGHAEIAERLGKTADAVKKQYSRPHSGSQAKFKCILEKNMAKHRLTLRDMTEE